VSVWVHSKRREEVEPPILKSLVRTILTDCEEGAEHGDRGCRPGGSIEGAGHPVVAFVQTTHCEARLVVAARLGSSVVDLGKAPGRGVSDNQDQFGCGSWMHKRRKVVKGHLHPVFWFCLLGIPGMTGAFWSHVDSPKDGGFCLIKGTVLVKNTDEGRSTAVSVKLLLQKGTEGLPVWATRSRATCELLAQCALDSYVQLVRYRTA
jgi:hypothetical protein